MKSRRKRLAVLDKLEAAYRDCDRCGLCKTRKNVVHWRGNPYAKLCAIGEAPGHDEDDKGVPFVGLAGRKLDSLLVAAHLTPSQDIFIINLVGCRPPNNRIPYSEECRACRPRLEMLLTIAKPRALLLLGKTAAQRMAGITSIKQWRGRETDVEIHSSKRSISLMGVPTYHPSYLARLGDDPQVRQQMIDDIEKAWRLAS